MESQDLGEFKTVSNTLRDSNLESTDLIVGWVLIDGDLKQLAFTEHDLRRPIHRARDNTEDLPTLGSKPPTHDQFQKVHDEADRLRKENEALKNRGWWDRLLNRMPDNE